MTKLAPLTNSNSENRPRSWSNENERLWYRVIVVRNFRPSGANIRGSEQPMSLSKLLKERSLDRILHVEGFLLSKVAMSEIELHGWLEIK